MSRLKSTKIPVVEVLRGLAALFVTWFHMTNTYGSGIVKYSGSNGWLGVEVFFVISGFIIPYSLSNMRENYKLVHYHKFLLKRILRIEPPYIASILFVLIIWYASSLHPSFKGEGLNTSFEQFLYHMFYLIPFSDYGWYQPVYWTLAYEFVFYMSIGVIFPLIRKSKESLLFAYLFMYPVLYVLSYDIYLLLFFVGVCLFLLQRKGRFFVKGRKIHFVMLMLIAMFLIYEQNIKIFFAASFAVSVIVVFSNVEFQGFVGRVLLRLGGISYSLYLVHIPVGGRVVNIGRRYIDGEVGQLALSLFAVLVSLLVAIVFYRLVEKPAISLSKKIFAT